MVTSANQATDKYAELTACFRAGVAGDAEQYAAFLRAVSAILRRMIGKKLSASDVEDVLQETLIAVHKARHTYDGERPLMPWLFAIAQFRITDHLRKLYAGRRETVDVDEIADTLADASVSVTESTADAEYMNALLQYIPEREKRILTMMHVEGYSAKETGKRLGMKESAVKVAAHRAIKKIREKLKT